MNTDDLKRKAAAAVPSKDSLITRLTLLKQTSKLPAATSPGWPGVFAAIAASSDQRLNDDQLIPALYATRVGQNLKAMTTGLFGSDTAEGAVANFKAARKEAFFVFVQPTSLVTLDQESYPGTYRYTDVGELFSRNAIAKDPTRLSRRVQETAQMMMRLAYGNTAFTSGFVTSTRTIATAGALGRLHTERVAPKYKVSKTSTRSLYNQGGASWTLLTFSYLVARAWKQAQTSSTGGSWSYHFDETAWYRFWAIVGSAMGISWDLIPTSHAEAATLYQAFIDAKLALADGEQNPKHDQIFTTYDDKDMPNRGEYLALLSWLPSYVLMQVPRLTNWVPYLGVMSLRTIGSIGSWLKKKTWG